jgi:ABC-2 type transport system ATP-binding protein
MERDEMKPAIVVQDLRKVYGIPSSDPGTGVVAVDDISFEVQTGEIFGMVGPNGAGKTSAIECIEGLRKRSGGSVSTLGLDPERDGYELRKQIGVQLQEAALPDRLKVWEALDLFASFYPRPVDWQPMLDQLGLEEKKTAAFSKLSGGQKQRLFIALALTNDPDLVFLDELTTGLDPQARRAMWNLVRSIRERGKTVFLTTHYMEEAERLCDRVAILDHGRIVALDTPENLVRSLGVESRVVFTVDSPLPDPVLDSVDAITRVERIGERFVVYGRGEDLVVGVVSALAAAKVRFRDLRTEQASLEDVFLAVTGREMRE